MCFHATFNVYAACTVIVRQITITNIAMRRVYRYGRGIKRVLNVRQT
jgi:hypothetical protein